MEINKSTTKNICKIIAFGLILFFSIQKFDMVLNIIGFVLDLLMPFLIGGAIAFVFSVPMGHFEKFLKSKIKIEKGTRFIAWLATFVSILLVLFVVIFFALPEFARTLELIAKQIEQFYIKLPFYAQQLEEVMPHIDSFIQEMGIDWQTISQSVIKTIQSFVSGILYSSSNILMGIASSVTLGVLGFIFSLYVLFTKEKLAIALTKVLQAMLPKEKVDRIIYVGSLTYKTFANFLSGQCLEAIILGAIFVVAMTIFNMPYAVLIGMVIAITALIPIFGAFIGCIVGVFLIIMVSPIKAFWFVVMFLIIQQLENNLIYPYVVGSSIGLPSILMFMSVIIGGNLMGILGMLLFIPLSSVLYTLSKEYVDNRLNKELSVPISEIEDILEQ